MKRLEFIAGLAGAAAWPIAAGGQQAERVRRIGALMDPDESNVEGQARIAAFRQGLEQLGWMELVSAGRAPRYGVGQRHHSAAALR
jgi:putative ABC transport system substrate-binding protein